MKFLKIALLVTMIAIIGAGAAWAENANNQGEKKRHPSYNLMGRDSQQVAEDSPLNPNFMVADEARMSEGKFWRSSYLNESLVGLVVYDIDGDGKNEVVYASGRNVYVARVTGEQMQQLAKYTFPVTDNIVSLDALDLTGDGRMEIIVSTQNDKQMPIAQILSFSGGEISALATNIPWYLRVVGAPNGRFLAGQKGATSKGAVYSGKVMRMAFDGSKVTTQGAVGLPDYVNLYNFTIGRLGSGGMQLTAAIKFPSEHIFLYEGSNKSWESKEEYGGTMNFLRLPMTGLEEKKREFLPSRILLADIDGDGQNELIVAKNDRGGAAFMSGQRGFTGGAMQVFKYANMSLTPYFRSRSLPGAAVDYALADLNNNGSLDLVVAVVTEQKSGMMQEGRSVIVAYELYPNSGKK